MFQIRRRQFDLLSDVAVKDFELRMAEHLRKFFPDHCKALGEQKLFETIRYGIKSASNYAIETERDVCIFIDHMFMLGRDFDKDPELQWAGEILENTTEMSARERVDALHAECCRQLQAADGVHHAEP